MKYSITGDQLYHFEKQGSIEFEQLISENELTILRNELKKTLSLYNTTLSATAVRKILFASSLAEIAGRLAKRQKIRFAFDEYIPSITSFSCSKDPFILSDRSGITPVVSMMLCIGGSEIQLEQSPPEPQFVEGKPFVKPLSFIDPFPQKSGNAIFFLPTKAWDKSCFIRHQEQQFLLVCYGDAHIRYLYCEEDPYLHELKKLGLVFGDALPESSHPTLWRG